MVRPLPSTHSKANKPARLLFSTKSTQLSQCRTFGWQAFAFNCSSLPATALSLQHNCPASPHGLSKPLWLGLKPPTFLLYSQPRPPRLLCLLKLSSFTKASKPPHSSRLNPLTRRLQSCHACRSCDGLSVCGVCFFRFPLPRRGCG